MFFWLLAVPAAKAWRRHEGIKFHAVLEMMYAAVSDIEQLLAGDLPGGYSRHSRAPFCPTGEQQRQALEEICQVGTTNGGTNTGLRRRHS